MTDAKFLVDWKFPVGKADKQPEIPLRARIQALVRRRRGGEDVDLVIAEVFETYGRTIPKRGSQVMAGWSRTIDRRVAEGDAEVMRLCEEEGLPEKPAGDSSHDAAIE